MSSSTISSTARRRKSGKLASVRLLPNLEDPREMVRTPNDRPAPAGFGPLDATWPQRTALMGTYDDRWLREDFPGLPKDLDWAAFNALPQVEDESDFHCVTTWSLLDSRWKGVSFSTLAALVQPKASAGFVMAYAADGYTTNVSLEEAMKDDVLLVHTWNGAPLPREHGGPVRMITPQLYAWKGAKWINRLEFMIANKRGFWEERGYSNTAHPWRDDRYS